MSHPLLQRQLAKYLGDPGSWPPLILPFVSAVEAAYHQADTDRTLLERSLDLSSQELLQANVDLRAIVQTFPDVFLWLDATGRVRDCRAHDSSDLLLFSDLVGRPLREIADADVATKFVAAFDQVASGAPMVTIEYSLAVQDETRYYEARFVPGHARQTLAIVRNISDRRRAEQSLRDREEQLRQAQRMEAVGLLAGGVAHDFNNVLTAIAGYSSLVLDQMEATHPLREDVEQIQKAGKSGAGLTQQLLAFSRRQLLRPTTVNPNTVVARTKMLLRPLIGEHILVTTDLSEDVSCIRADAGQLEQILTNLAVNARDAMPAGGRLTIETENVLLDSDALADQSETGAGPPPGPYVRLSVSDTGQGIPPDIQSRIFEPFFTTKRRGEGTGLGLSTVYGIVRQSGGVVRLYSRVSHGTTFHLYFPAVAGAVEEAEATVTSAPSGSETILVAEDQSEVRSVTCQALTSRGYKVLAAESGERALELVAKHASAIDMLVTDVVMPNMGGRQLAECLLDLFPDMRVLYVSGYTDDEILRQGIVQSSVEFLHKPFTPQSLLQKVREVLDRPPTIS